MKVEMNHQKTLTSPSELNSEKMKKENAIKLFEQQQVRIHWDDDEEKWYFSIVDLVAILFQSKNPQAYWRKLKQRLKKEMKP